MEANTVGIEATREFLNRARVLQREIERKERRIQTLRDMATSTTAAMSDMPRSDSPNLQRMETVLCKAADLEAEINNDMERLDMIKAETTEAISGLEDYREQQVLYGRYVGSKAWIDIAAECSCARVTVMRYHQSGVAHLAEKWAGKVDT